MTFFLNKPINTILSIKCAGKLSNIRYISYSVVFEISFNRWNAGLHKQQIAWNWRHHTYTGKK